MDKHYDYTIIGGGPSGIYCADKLSLLGYKVCLIESLESLGGCHRVRYAKNVMNENELVHTEHGPRIYLGSYLDFWKWIKTIMIDKHIHFKKYKFDIFSNDFVSFTKIFKIYELISLIIVYVIHCIFKYPLSNTYTLNDFTNDLHFTENGKHALNRLARLIDGGNIDKTILSAFIKGVDTGIIYNIYEPNLSMDHLVWNKFKKKLKKQNVDILLNTNVFKVDIGVITTNKGDINTKKTILAIPPYALNKIKNASLLCGYDPKTFSKLANYQQYEPYVCATIEFKNISKKDKWGISDEHPWGLIAIDMGRYFTHIQGSMYITSITHPEKVDFKTNKTANEMNRQEFLDRIVELVKMRFNINEEPIKKTLSPNVEKINGGWIERDRAYLFSPPGWLKPNFNISLKNNVYTTGHHIGDSYHDYNSMESAIQNSSVLLSKIEDNYNYNITKPWLLSSVIWIILLICVLVFIHKYNKHIVKLYKKLLKNKFKI